MAGTNLVEARRAGISEANLREAGFTEPDVKKASRQAQAIDALRRFTTDGQVNPVAALDGGVTADTLRRAGISKAAISQANRTRKAQERLSFFTDPQGNIDVIRALRLGVSEQTLRDAGVTSEFLQQEVRPTLAALKRLEKFNTKAGLNLNDAVRSLDAATLTRVGITEGQIANAKRQNRALDKLAQFKKKDGSHDLVDAKRNDIANSVLQEAGFTDREIKSAANRVLAFNRLRPFSTTGGGIDIVAALSTREGKKRGITPALLANAGFTKEQINEAQELGRNLNPVVGTRQWYTNVGKQVGITAADAIVPGLWVRNWSKLSNRERAVNIAFDALFLVPLVGVAARGAKVARAGARLGKAERGTRNNLSAVRAARQADKVDLRPRLTLDEFNARIKSQPQFEKFRKDPEFIKTLEAGPRLTPDELFKRLNSQPQFEKFRKDPDFLKAIREGPSLTIDEFAERIRSRPSLKSFRGSTERAKLLDEAFEASRGMTIDEFAAALRSRPKTKQFIKNAAFRKALREGPELTIDEVVARVRAQPAFQKFNKDPAFLKGLREGPQLTADEFIARLRKQPELRRRFRSRAELEELGRRIRNEVDPLEFPPMSRTARARDNNLIKAAAAIKRIVRRKSDAKTANDAERAVLEIGEALRAGNPKALAAPAKRLALIGRRTDLPALTGRVRPLLNANSATDMTDFFKKAAQQADDLPKTPKGVKDKIDDPDEFLDGGKRLERSVEDVDLETLGKDILVSERKLRDLKKRKVRTDIQEQLKERIQRTRVQVKERTATKPVFDIFTRVSLAGPLARAGVGAKEIARTKTRALAKRKTETRQLAKRDVRTSAKPQSTRATSARPETKVKRTTIVAPLTRTRPEAKTATQLAAKTETKTAPLPTVKVSTKTLAKTQAETKTQVAPGVRTQPKAQPKTETATAIETKPETLPAVQTKPVTAPATQVETKLITKPTTKTPTKTVTRVPTRTPTKTPTKVVRSKARRDFDLPGDAEKVLKPGEFPRVISFRQGLVNVLVDIDRGTRTFSRATGTGKGITPESTFKVVTKDRTRPTRKTFRQGIVDVNVTPRSLSFTSRLRGKRRKQV